MTGAGGFPFHPLANLFPLIEGAEFDALVASVRDSGQRDDCMLHEGMILDGRNRARACDAAKIACRFSNLPASQDALRYVIDKNLMRRHLNESQRAFVAAKIANMGQGRPAAEKPANLRVKQADAAKLLNVSERSVQSANVVRERGTPDLQRAVETGKIAVSEAAKAAVLSEDKQAEVAKEAESGRANIVRSVIKKEARAARERTLGAKQCALPDAKFGFILADPEWDRTTRSPAGRDRHAEQHYPVSSDEIIAARDVASIAADDSICALWCTDPHRGVDVLRAWGFEPKSYFVWVKDIVELSVEECLAADLSHGRYFKAVGVAGTGFWNRDRDELLLIGTRGNPPCPAPGTQGESVWFAARPRDDENRIIHSAKPECSLLWIEAHFPNMPKIELNRRGAPRRAGLLGAMKRSKRHDRQAKQLLCVT